MRYEQPGPHCTTPQLLLYLIYVTAVLTLLQPRSNLACHSLPFCLPPSSPEFTYRSMPAIPWLSSSSQPKQPTPPPPPAPQFSKEYPLELIDHFRSKLHSIPHETQALVLGGFVLGGVSSIGVIWAHRRFFQRIPNSGWVTPRDLERKRWVRGVVTRYVARVFRVCSPLSSLALFAISLCSVCELLELK